MSSTGIQDAAEAAAGADVAVVVLGTGTLLEKEGLDRTTLQLPEVQQQLLAAVSGRVGPERVVLFMQAAGPVTFDDSMAGAALLQGYGGEEAGHGFADVLLGRVAPSARLPVTVFTEQYLDHVEPLSDFRMAGPGTGRTYRFLPPNSSLMQYTFGYGLSYARFEYANLKLTPLFQGETGALKSGWVGVNVTVQVTRIDGAKRAFTGVVREPVQLYVSSPQVAPEALELQYGLAAISMADLDPGQTVSVSMYLPREIFLSTSSNGTRVLVAGSHTVYASGHAPGDPRGTEASNVVRDVL